MLMGVICISAFMIPFCELFKFFSSVGWVDSFFANPLPNQYILLYLQYCFVTSSKRQCTGVSWCHYKNSSSTHTQTVIAVTFSDHITSACNVISSTPHSPAASSLPGARKRPAKPSAFTPIRYWMFRTRYSVFGAGVRFTVQSIEYQVLTAFLPAILIVCISRGVDCCWCFVDIDSMPRLSSWCGPVLQHSSRHVRSFHAPINQPTNNNNNTTSSNWNASFPEEDRIIPIPGILVSGIWYPVSGILTSHYCGLGVQ